eukprot:scaffold73963_cov36-Phaeocystis_antarctica.AAC.1
MHSTAIALRQQLEAEPTGSAAEKSRVYDLRHALQSDLGPLRTASLPATVNLDAGSLQKTQDFWVRSARHEPSTIVLDSCANTTPFAWPPACDLARLHALPFGCRRRLGSRPKRSRSGRWTWRSATQWCSAGHAT